MDILSFVAGAIVGVLVLGLLLCIVSDGRTGDGVILAPKGDVPPFPLYPPTPRPTNSRGSQPTIPANPYPPPKMRGTPILSAPPRADETIAYTPSRGPQSLPPWGDDGPAGAHSPRNLRPVVPRPWGERGPT